MGELMKGLFIVALILSLPAGYSAELIVDYRFTLTGGAAVPPNDSAFTASGSFGAFDDGSFNLIVFAVEFDHTGINITRSEDPQETGTVIHTGILEAIVPRGDELFYSYRVDGLMTPEDTADLHAGYWYANLTSTALPDGVLRAQIIPEPSIASVLVLALLVFGSIRISGRLRKSQRE